MTKKPKLLWCGDIVAKTGFARVTENVLSRIENDMLVLLRTVKPDAQFQEAAH
jgi:hypothetical protein